MVMDIGKSTTDLFKTVKEIIVRARQSAYRSNKSILLNIYWDIGKLIVNEEQQGKAFPIRDALRPELSWTHYRIISRIDDNKLRLEKTPA